MVRRTCSVCADDDDEKNVVEHKRAEQKRKQ
jgi:hypothetical protein